MPRLAIIIKVHSYVPAKRRVKRLSRLMFGSSVEGPNLSDLAKMLSQSNHLGQKFAHLIHLGCQTSSLSQGKDEANVVRNSQNFPLPVSTKFCYPMSNPSLASFMKLDELYLSSQNLWLKCGKKICHLSGMTKITSTQLWDQVLGRDGVL